MLCIQDLVELPDPIKEIVLQIISALIYANITNRVDQYVQKNKYLIIRDSTRKKLLPSLTMNVKNTEEVPISREQAFSRRVTNK